MLRYQYCRGWQKVVAQVNYGGQQDSDLPYDAPAAHRVAAWRVLVWEPYRLGFTA